MRTLHPFYINNALDYLKIWAPDLLDAVTDGPSLIKAVKKLKKREPDVSIFTLRQDKPIYTKVSKNKNS